MNILITGASGLIGKELGKKLVSEGHSVVVTSRNPEKTKLLLPFPCKVFKTPGEALREKIDGIIHLAGESIFSKRWNTEQKKKILDSRVETSKELIQAIQDSKTELKTFVTGSAIGYYGSRGDEVLNEYATPGDDFLAQVCIAWEDTLFKASLPNVRKVAVRIGLVLARSGGALEQVVPLFRAGVGGPIGSGKQWWSWIHIEDTVELIYQAAINPKIEGVINVVSPGAVTNEEFSKVLGQVLHKPSFLKAPSFAMKLTMGEMSGAILSSQRVNPEKAQTLGLKFKYAGLEAALTDLCGDLQGNQKEFYAEQWVPKKVEEIFPFFTSAKNLEAITPPWLNFNVLKVSTPDIEQGTLIDYKLKIHGIPIHWLTRIEDMVVNQQFVDTQIKGPYKKWHHTHSFERLAGGTLLKDRVLYQVPVGKLGSAMLGKKILNDVTQIFDFRRRKINEMFG